jgi:hypothetical protein
MTKMRAKMIVESSVPMGEAGTTEVLKMRAVPKSTAYPADGSDEDNTYAQYSPYGALELHIANPNLHGKFKAGDKFYVDFTPAE